MSGCGRNLLAGLAHVAHGKNDQEEGGDAHVVLLMLSPDFKYRLVSVVFHLDMCVSHQNDWIEFACKS